MRNSCSSSLGRCRCAKANGVVDVLVCRCLHHTVKKMRYEFSQDRKEAL